MATITKRKNAGRTGPTVSFVATVRRKGFSSASKSFPTRAEALAWAQSLEKELVEQRARGGLRHDVATLTVRELVTEYKKDPAATTLKSYTSIEPLLDWWTDNCGNRRCMDFGVLALREARSLLASTGERKIKDAEGKLIVRKRGPATINRHLAALRSCWNWGRRAGLLPTSAVWPDGLALSEPPGRDRYLTEDELARLLTAAKAYSPVMYAAVALSIGSGIRKGELLGLTWADVDLSAQTLRLPVTKNGRKRATHFPAFATDSLRALAAGKVTNIGAVLTQENGQPLGTSKLDARWRSIIKSAGIKGFHWHDMRHTCASLLATNGATLLEIGHQLGHTSPQSTYRYAHLVQGRAVTGHAELDKAMRDALSTPPKAASNVVELKP